LAGEQRLLSSHPQPPLSPFRQAVSLLVVVRHVGDRAFQHPRVQGSTQVPWQNSGYTPSC
jgi:hypothetical protein